MGHYTIEGETNTVTWGFLPGTASKLLLIKTGMGGSIYGYQEKYFHIAQHFNSLGYNVLCCSTPQTVNDRLSFETAIEVAKAQMGDHFPDCTIHYMGISRGAYQGILFGNTIPQIEALLLINSPIMVNFSKQLAALRGLDKHSVLVIGTKDPSFQFWPFLQKIENPKLKMIEVTDADHHFKGMNKEFFDLPLNVFLSKHQQQ